MATNAVYNLMPDLTFAGSIIVAYLLSSTFPVAHFILFPMNLIGWAIIFFTFSLAISILSDLKAKHTSTDAAGMPSSLVTAGMYKYSRNPFYFLLMLTTIGAALVLGTIVAFVAPVLYFLILHVIIIPIEERNLQIQFGLEYEKYKHTVRRWI